VRAHPAVSLQIKHMPPEFAADDFALSQERWDEVASPSFPARPLCALPPNALTA
jgi:hypothetical protein